MVEVNLSEPRIFPETVYNDRASLTIDRQASGGEPLRVSGSQPIIDGGHGDQELEGMTARLFDDILDEWWGGMES